jgi:hypothetical protein
MAWILTVNKRVEKQIRQLPPKMKDTLIFLLREIEELGPVRGNWPNYSKLGSGRHHCHLRKQGRPTYVVVWEEKDREIKVVEVTYVGTRENAPY